MEDILPLPAFIASLAPKTLDDARRLLRLVPEKANAVEYRLDQAPGAIDPGRLRQLDPRAAIVTWRTEGEGGRFNGSRAEYVARLNQAYEAGAIVDVELESRLLSDRAFLPDRRRVIGSRHGAALSTEKIRSYLSVDAGVIKVVETGATTVAQVLECVSRLRELSGGRPFAHFAAGTRGMISRILAPRLGSALTYGSVEVETAPGQLSLAELLETYRADAGNPIARIFAVYGADVSTSLSPKIHNELFSRRKLDFLYVPLSATPSPNGASSVLRTDLESLDSLGIPLGGVSVTNPFKSAFESVVEAIDEDDAVARTGAANTLVRIGERARALRFFARNTDAEAVFEILAGGGVAGRRLLIRGSGGAARAAAYAGRRAECEVLMTGRSPESVRKVADRFGASVIAQEELAGIEVDVLVNATPLGGTNGDPRPFPAGLFRRRPLAVDFVYRSSGETPFMEEAAEFGCETAPGREVLARQAVGQAHFFGAEGATHEEIREIVNRP